MPAEVPSKSGRDWRTACSGLTNDLATNATTDFLRLLIERMPLNIICFLCCILPKEDFSAFL